jgi:hypothetical protein
MKTQLLVPTDLFKPTAPVSDDRPRVLAAPGLLEQDYEVVRDEDDSDEDYEQRRAFFALVINAARKP